MVGGEAGYFCVYDSCIMRQCGIISQNICLRQVYSILISSNNMRSMLWEKMNDNAGCVIGGHDDYLIIFYRDMEPWSSFE